MNRVLFRIAVSFLTLLFGIIGVSFWLTQSNSNNLQKDTEKNIQPMPVTSRSIEEMDIAEAVFRKQLEWNQQEKVCFLTIEGKEPDENFLSRFQGQTEPRIQRASQKSRDKYDRLIDSTTGENAEIISIVSIKWLNNDEAEVHTNIYDGDVIEYTQNVILNDGHWVAQDGHYLEEIPYKEPYYSDNK